jgi:hypothetical protein
LFRFATVVHCPEAKMLESIGPTRVCSAVTCTSGVPRTLIGAVHIDRLNLGPAPTIELNRLQPCERNIIDFFLRVWVCRLAMMVLPIYTHGQRAGVRVGRVGSEVRRHLIRRLFVNSPVAN